MKTVLTLATILIIGATALANTQTDVKIDGIEMGVVLVAGASDLDGTPQTTIGAEDGVARLYRYENSRVKKALSFVTKRTKAKLA